MKLFKYLLLGGIFIFSFSACERLKESDVILPFEGDKMVIYGRFNEDKATIEVTQNQLALANDTVDFNWNLPLSASLKENGKIVEDFEFESNIGNLNYEFQLDSLYTIEVSSENFEVFSEPVNLLAQPQINNLNYALDADTSEIIIDFRFLDTDEGKNYYSYNIIQKSEGEIIEQRRHEFAIFDDSDFNLSDKAITYRIERLEKVIFENYQLIGRVQIDEIIVKLYHHNPAIFEFYESIKDSNLGGTFTEQKPLVSNINNGYGFWSCAVADSVIISL